METLDLGGNVLTRLEGIEGLGGSLVKLVVDGNRLLAVEDCVGMLTGL